jgi:hypothetical protein
MLPLADIEYQKNLLWVIPLHGATTVTNNTVYVISIYERNGNYIVLFIHEIFT